MYHRIFTAINRLISTGLETILQDPDCRAMSEKGAQVFFHIYVTGCTERKENTDNAARCSFFICIQVCSKYQPSTERAIKLQSPDDHICNCFANSSLVDILKFFYPNVVLLSCRHFHEVPNVSLLCSTGFFYLCYF